MAARSSAESVQNQTLRSVELLASPGLREGLAEARGEWVLVLTAGDTLERNACRNLWEAALRTGADCVLGRTVLQPVGGKPEDTLAPREIFARSRVLGSLGEVPELTAQDGTLAGELTGGALLRRELLERHGPGPAAAVARADRVALVPNLVVRRLPDSFVTRCEPDPDRPGRLLVAGHLAAPPAESGDEPPRCTVEFRARRSGRLVDLPADEVRQEGGILHWRASLPLRTALRPHGVRETAWDLCLATESGGKSRTRAVGHPAAQGDAAALTEETCVTVPARARPTRLLGDAWRPYVTEHGRIALSLVRRAPHARYGGALIRRAVALSPLRVLRAGSRKLRGKRDWMLSTQVKLRVYDRWMCRLPVRRGSVAFESRQGEEYGGNPRALYEELRRRRPRAHCTWSYEGSPDGFPRDARLVPRWSYRYLLALARAEFWVDDRGFPHSLRKRKETTYIQTWHGSAYRRRGFDQPGVRVRTAAAREELEKTLKRFDHFLVRSEYDVRTLAPALRIPEKKLLRTGYPRNDRLVAERQRDWDPGRLPRGPLAESLGLPDDKTVLLYAPTLHGCGGARGRTRLPFDAERFAGKFGDTCVLLFRAHPDAGRPVVVPEAARGAVVDVSDHPDATDLLVLADALVTDGSSLMFDYALLHRPMVFFIPGADDRTDQGGYFDLRACAPGPVAATEEELFAALAGLKAVDSDYAAARRKFAAEYGEYDTGGAAAAVVERFFLTDGNGRNGR